MHDMSLFVLAHLWESTVFGLVCAALILALEKSWSYNRHLLAWASILKFLLPFSALAPLLSFAKNYFRSDASAVSPVATYFGLTADALQIDTWIGFGSEKARISASIPWETVASCIWLIGTLCLFARWFWQYAVTRRIIARACSPASERWLSIARDVWKRPVRAMPSILVCHDRNALAGVFGLFRQSIVIPGTFESDLGLDEREAFLRHEFQHVYKRDTLWLFVQKLIRNLFWVHPLVWWLDRQISAEREILRDEEVIRKTENVTSYLNCLMKASTIKLPRSYATGVGIKGSPFAKRVKAIARIKPSRWTGVLSAGGSITAVAALTLFLSVSLSFSELRAENENAKPDHPGLKIEPSLTTEEQNTVKEILAILNEERDSEKALDQTYDAITEDSSAAFEFIAANFLVEKGELEKAIEFYQAAVDKFPTFLRAIKNVGIMQLKLGRFEDAKKSLLHAMRLGSDDTTTNGLLALCYANESDWTSAEHYYRSAIDLDATVTDWQIGLAKVLYQQGRKSEADSMMRNVVKTMQERGQEASADELLNKWNAPDRLPAFKKGDTDTSAR